jgi:hypothetical protein
MKQGETVENSFWSRLISSHRVEPRVNERTQSERFMESGFSQLRMYWSHEPTLNRGDTKNAEKDGNA